MAEAPSFDPAAPLSAVPDWWLELRCGCGRTVQSPRRLLVREHGPAARAPELVARMRCERCGSRPAAAEWIDNPQGGARGTDYPPPRRVPVLRED
jgi:hypothetical protein